MSPVKSKLISGFLIGIAVFLSLGNRANTRILTFEEKKEIAREMKKINKSLGVKCGFCHLEAEKGLKNGDYTRLTEEGEKAHKTMFPLSKKFKVGCDYCHAGKESFTAEGKIADKHFAYMKKFNKKSKGKISCETCHIPGKGSFKTLTEWGKKKMSVIEKN